MPPKPVNSVDGISRPSNTNNVADVPALKVPAFSAEKSPQENSSPPAYKAQVKTSKVKRGPAIPILITLILMVLLIGLAYYAYNKSK